MTALRKATGAEAREAEAIATAIDELTEMDIDRLDGWQPLAELSSHTEFAAIGADRSSVVLAGRSFEAIADVYVVLHYGHGEDAESLSDSYVATVRGTIEGDQVTIEQISVDTSPFYS